MTEDAELRGRHVVCFSWRDTHNPEGGGAEYYLEQVARELVARGCRVTIFSAAHAAAPPREERDGIRFVRAGSKLTVYLRGFLALLLGRFGRVDLVVDVQNGLPFFTPLATRRPVVVLVHHVHREQWPVVYPGLAGTVGWWIESRLAPRLYRRCQYVTVSRATRRELVHLGVEARRIAVVHNGAHPAPPDGASRSPEPSICVVGRLVPHKQVEHALEAVAALRREFPGIRLHVVGTGWWESELRAYAARLGVTGAVEFHGFVAEQVKHEVYAHCWVLVLPSLKEGWGLVVAEAGMHGTPTLAYRAAGGTTESVADGVSGVLVDDHEQLLRALAALLRDADWRGRLAQGAISTSHRFAWDHTQAVFAHVLAEATSGRTVSADDETD